MTQGLKSAGLTMRHLRAIAEHALERGLGLIDDPIPGDLRQERRLMPQHDALRQLHMPASLDQIELAKYSMKYEELLVY